MISRWSAVPQALCLVLFPLSFMLLSNTGLHPGFDGSAAEQIEALAGNATRWRWVHLGMAGGSLLGLVVLLTLRSLMPRSHVVVHAAVALGVIGAAVLTGIFALEATLVVELAQACVESGSVVPFIGKPDVSRSFRRPCTQPRPALVPKRRRVAGSRLCPCRDGAKHAGTRPARVIADNGRISSRLSLRACPARRTAGAAVLRLPHHAGRVMRTRVSLVANIPIGRPAPLPRLPGPLSEALAAGTIVVKRDFA